jgi:hypothetical protein
MSVAVPASPLKPKLWVKALKISAITATWAVLFGITVWAIAALYIDIRTPFWRIPFALTYAAGALVAVVKLPSRIAQACLVAGFGVVLLWWLALKPTNEGPWTPNNARTAWAETAGDALTIHNLRNCEYRSEEDYSNCWHERVVHLSNLRGADFTLTSWGSESIAHPIISFDFGSDGHLAFSLEVRYRPGQTYSAILGFFRQSPLILIAADERDVLRLRTNYRIGEDVYLYRTTVTPDTTKAIFLTYSRYLNRLHEQPEWYNALTQNCTTAISRQIETDVPDPKPWDYRLVLNGKLDELMYSRGRLVSGGIPFAALRAQAHINPAAKAADGDPDFSSRIRAGRVGF